MSSTFGELSVTNDVPSHHLLMVLGALNAHLSKVDSERDMIHDGRYYHQRTNHNGNLLKECCLEANNHRFETKKSMQPALT